MNNKKILKLSDYKECNNIIEKNSSSSIIDIGNNILCLEFHSSPINYNPIDEKIITNIHMTIKIARDKHYSGIIIGHEYENFSIGAKLELLYNLIVRKNWAELEKAVFMMQEANKIIKTSPVPVVAAIRGMTLGGGCEIALHCHSIQCITNTYMGLTETCVGLIPCGGGIKEIMLRCRKNTLDDTISILKSFLKSLVFGKITQNSEDALKTGFLNSNNDSYSNKKDELLFNAKKKALELAQNGFVPKNEKKILVSGQKGYQELVLYLKELYEQNLITEYSLFIGKKIAKILCGGKNSISGIKKTEQEILEMEREVFVSLCGETRTVDRLQYMIKNNRPMLI